MKTLLLLSLTMLLGISVVPVTAGVKLVESTNVQVYGKACTTPISLSSGKRPFFGANEVIVKFTAENASVIVAVTCNGNSKNAFYFTLTRGSLELNKVYKFRFPCDKNGKTTNEVEVMEAACTGDKSKIIINLNCKQNCSLPGTVVFGGQGPILNEAAKFFSDAAISPSLYAPENLKTGLGELVNPTIANPLATLQTSDVTIAQNTLINSFKTSIADNLISINSPADKVDYFLLVNKAYLPATLNAQNVFTPNLRQELLKISK